MSSPRCVAWIVATLLGLYGVMSWTASLEKGVSFDEGLQLAVGYNIWLNHDFRMEGANGDLIRRWATLPYLITRPKFVGHDDPLWQQSRAYDLGWRFFFELGNRPESLLRPARAMMTVLGIATGLLIFWWSRELFGVSGGLVSLALFVFSPSMLAFGSIVSTDMSITLTLFAVTWCIWRVLHEISAWRLGASLGWTGLLVLAKPAALVVFPITAVLIAVRLVAGGPLLIRWGRKSWTIARRPRLAGLIGLVALLHVLAGWSALWAHYEFRYAASPRPDDPSLVFYSPQTRDRVPTVFAGSLQWMKRTKFLPEGFVRGIDSLLSCDDYLGAYKVGELRFGGWRTFFPYAIWVKTPPPLFLVLALGGFAWWQRHRLPGGSRELAPRPPEGVHRYYAATPHLALIGCYLAVAMTEDLNIGHRHVLPIYPSLYVLAGAAGLAWQRRSVWLQGATVAAVAWLTIESFSIRPHYLAFFGPQAGGPASGYKHLVDSSVDWGMNLPELKKWLDVHNPDGRQPVFLSYFGSDNPDYYGIKARRLPGFFERRNGLRYPILPGYYVISASLLQSVYTAAFGPWSEAYEQMYWDGVRMAGEYEAATSDPARLKALLSRGSIAHWENEYDRYENLRLARLCAWLRHQRPPDATIGYGLLVWRLDEAELHAALRGPPVELADYPAFLHPLRTFVDQAQ